MNLPGAVLGKIKGRIARMSGRSTPRVASKTDVDRRAIYQSPRVYGYNGGYVYGDPLNPKQEECFDRGKASA